MNLLSYITNGFFSEEIQINNIFRLPISLDIKQKTKILDIKTKTKLEIQIKNKQTYNLNLKRKYHNIEFKKQPVDTVLKLEKK